jgi:hypothetical protein
MVTARRANDELMSTEIKQTSNAQRSTFNVQWGAWRIE